MYRNPNPDPGNIDSEYANNRTEAIKKQILDIDKLNWQEHHDHYVKKYRAAKSKNITLEPIEMKQYNLAMTREKQGFVKPLL